jgi:hypothetical protein
VEDELLQVRWQYAITEKNVESNETQSIGWRYSLVVKCPYHLVSHVLGLAVIFVKPSSQALLNGR